MNHTQRCCFVFWGEQCDEVAAVLFITNLRAIGMRVWVVGIGGRHNSGAHGLALVPDLALDEALPLAPASIAVIAPCRLDQWLRFLNDPRLVSFLTECVRHRAQLLMAEGGLSANAPLAHDAVGTITNAIRFYPTGNALYTFAHTFASTLE